MSPAIILLSAIRPMPTSNSLARSPGSNEAVDVRQLINQSELSRWQKRLIALCFIVVALDGMDIALMGFVAPTLKAGWGVSNHQLGPVISAALVGLALGAMCWLTATADA